MSFQNYVENLPSGPELFINLAITSVAVTIMVGSVAAATVIIRWAF